MCDGIDTSCAWSGFGARESRRGAPRTTLQPPLQRRIAPSTASIALKASAAAVLPQRDTKEKMFAALRGGAVALRTATLRHKATTHTLFYATTQNPPAIFPAARRRASTAAPPGDDDDAATKNKPDRLPTPKDDATLSKAAPELTDEQKKKLAEQWAGYVDYMGNQRDKGWKT